MQTSNETLVSNATHHRAELVSSHRITPESSREEVRQLVFRTDAPEFDGKPGSCIRVMAPGQYGNKYHTRLYSIADQERSGPIATQFSLCVRRCFYIDDFNGEQYEGVASNYLCNLRPGETIEFAGPVGYPFAVPDNRNANILMIGMGTGIAPFRGLIRLIYEKFVRWEGKVRLYYGARTGLEMLYMNDVNNDLANYYDQPTFKAFQAISPRPVFDVPIELDKAIERNAAEVWEMLNSPDCRVYIAGTNAMLGQVEKAMVGIAGSAEAWLRMRNELVSRGHWAEVLY
ncbi:MAG TPA: FAD-binding oxidoreductase [Rhodocyclaceae bacterium]|nr:FAD-binding oxidoreductase [Rhodocyclaceae bacterium]